MDSCCIFRLPGEEKINCFGGRTKSGLHSGFVVAPFDLSEDVYTITNLENCEFSDAENIILSSDSSRSVYPFPIESATEELHRKIVEDIKEILTGDLSKKIIASKVIVKEGAIDLRKSFESLCHKFPKAFVFLFYTPQTGVWLGASPELLLKCENSTLSTYALAGTRPVDSNGEWDDKNVKEQEIVKNFIIDIFRSNGLHPSVSETTTRKVGSVEHLLTEINSPISASNNIGELLRLLSPTPALSGYPKEMAMNAIKSLENIPRGFYGGFLGPYNGSGNFNFYVNLRSIRIAPNHYSMQVGGGITALSDADEEWLETESKAASILSSLKLKY